MTGRWDTPGVPHKGWVDLGVHDEEEPNHICEMCQQAHVRFVHVMRHADHADLRVGCVCAEKMSNDYVTPKAREKYARNRLSRRAKWLTRKWRVSKSGNDYINNQGSNFAIFMQSGLWNYRVVGEGLALRYGRGGYRTSDEAKLGVFDAIWPPFKVTPRPP